MSDISHGFRIKSEEHCAFSYFSVGNTERERESFVFFKTKSCRERELVYELVLIKFKLGI